MDLRKVLFLGGPGLASVKIRCVDLAARLGCDCRLGPVDAAVVGERYSAFVCVKPRLAPGQREHLARKGIVIWDILDAPPPKDDVTHYLASSKLAKEIFQGYGRVTVIPHYHCNFSGKPNPPNLRRPGWIGSPQWRPRLSGFDCDYYDSTHLNREGVVAVHRQIGIGLNFRTTQPAIFAEQYRKLAYNFHVAINSGIKLINCLGFGTPSVSADEPAYEEIGGHCTIFSTPRACARWVRDLQNDRELYQDLRQKCLRKSAQYHIDTIAEKYRRFLTEL
jgi:hypothetical protein